MLAEQCDPDRDGEGAFEVQQQRPRRAADPFEPEEEQDGREHAAGDDEEGHTRRVGAPEPSFGTVAPAAEREGAERTEVQQARQHHRLGVVEEELGQRGAHAEGDRGGQAEQDAALVHPGCVHTATVATRRPSSVDPRCRARVTPVRAVDGGADTGANPTIVLVHGSGHTAACGVRCRGACATVRWPSTSPGGPTASPTSPT